jgi:hypothetical protein
MVVGAGFADSAGDSFLALRLGRLKVGEHVSRTFSRRSAPGSSTRYGVGYVRTTGRRDGSGVGGRYFSCERLRSGAGE